MSSSALRSVPMAPNQLRWERGWSDSGFASAVGGGNLDLEFDSVWVGAAAVGAGG